MTLVKVEKEKLEALMDLCEELQAKVKEYEDVEIVQITLPGDEEEVEETEELDNLSSIVNRNV